MSNKRNVTTHIYIAKPVAHKTKMNKNEQYWDGTPSALQWHWKCLGSGRQEQGGVNYVTIIRSSKIETLKHSFWGEYIGNRDNKAPLGFGNVFFSPSAIFVRSNEIAKRL